MPLIEVNIPETDDWEDSLAARIIMLLTALLLWRMGLRVMGKLYPEHLLGAVVGVLLFAVGTQLLVFTVTDLDLEVWGPRIAYSVLGIILGALLLVLLDGFMGMVGTDAMLFSKVSAEALVGGQNPYTMDFSSAIAQSDLQYTTPRIDGSAVSQFSYPAGSVLAFVPQLALVGHTPWGLRLTLIVGAAIASLLVIHMLPPKLALGGVVVFLAGRNMFLTAAGGIFWPLWLVPLLLAIHSWYREQWLYAAFFVGVSAGVKQFALIIVPFLAIWQLKRVGWRRLPRRAASMTSIGAAGFLLLNGPFIAANTSAWVDGVLTPLAGRAPMVQQGAGLALLPFVGVLDLPTWWHTLATGVVAIVALTAYWLYFERLRWAAWVTVPVILFPYSRTMINYFVPWGVVALLCILATWDRLDGPATAADVKHRRVVAADD